MDKRIKDKWVKALKSGKFEQTRDALEKNGAYCCLGVLEHGVCGVEYTESLKAQRPQWYFPSRQTLKKCKLGVSTTRKLAAMNDGLGEDHKPYSFPELADWIQEHL